MDIKEIQERLKAPFKPEEIEWRVGSTNADKTKGLALAYVTNRAIQNRLDEIFSPFGWRNEFKEWKGSSQLCGISVKHEGEWITKWDGADDSNMEAVKGGLSDAMKRAAYQWGIGRYLYEVPDQWVKIKQVGKSYAIAEEPRLPQEFLPTGYQYTKNRQPVNQEPAEDAKTEKPTAAKSKKSPLEQLQEEFKAPDKLFAELKEKYQNNPAKIREVLEYLRNKKIGAA